MEQIKELFEICQNLKCNDYNMDYNQFQTGNGLNNIKIIIHCGPDNINWLTVIINNEIIEKDKMVYDSVYFIDENDDRYQNAKFSVLKVPYALPELADICTADIPYMKSKQYKLYADPKTFYINPLSVTKIELETNTTDFNNLDDDEKGAKDFLINHWDEHNNKWKTPDDEEQYNTTTLKDSINMWMEVCNTDMNFYDFVFDKLTNLLNHKFSSQNVRLINNIDPITGDGSYKNDPNIHFDEQINNETVLVPHYRINDIQDVWIKTTLDIK